MERTSYKGTSYKLQGGKLQGDKLQVDKSEVGSGDFYAEEIRKNASMTVNGSGDILIDRASGDIRCAVSGSGDVTVKSGELEELTVQISGSGDFHGKGICTKTADLRTDNGDIVVGRVISESVERAGRIGKIAVCKRG